MSAIGKGFIALLALMGAIVLSTQAFSKPMTEERMQFFMEWAGQSAGYSTFRVELPYIVYLTHEELQIQYYGAQTTSLTRMTPTSI